MTKHFDGRGRLIHVSDFLNPECGRPIIRDTNVKVIQDACVIIYPGGGPNGVPWWDTTSQGSHSNF